MRLCRFKHAGQTSWGLYGEREIIACGELLAGELAGYELANETAPPLSISYEAALPIGGSPWLRLIDNLEQIEASPPAACPRLPTASVQLLPPLACPPKLLLLAGNYAEHVREQGGVAAEKERTFPYVFMKPPSTTMIGSGTAFHIPDNSPLKLDHEVELGVVIGRRLNEATIDQARESIVGYTVINDISNRGFRPNPNRETRPRDTFFDWQHGKWHDGSCPIGPCMLLASHAPDPQNMSLNLKIDGEVRQDGSTSQMIFDIYELIQFISSFMTLEPGDIISTGTPSGVGNATGRFLQRGATMEAEIASIGRVVTPIT